MDPEGIAARLWPGARVEIVALGGGITNRNFKVSVRGEVFVLRIAGKDTELLGIDRSVEHEASLAAWRAGVGPEVVTFLESEGCLVTRFIDGVAIPPEQMRRPDSIVRVANALRRVHDSAPIPGRFDAFRVVETYRETAEARGVRMPDRYASAKGIADAIERARGEQALRPCHNDLLNANFIDDGVSIRIVDWEYAGMGDVFFDLANFSVNHELAEGGNRAVLEAYFGSLRDADERALLLMRFMSDFREAMWGVVQQGISELDFDFAAYADEHFERMERTAGQPAFRNAFAAAASRS
jgi:thiamine kinase-like enzyme